MDKAFKNNNYRILELFIEYSSRDFSIRGIARQLKLSHATVIKHIKDLVKLKLVKKKEDTLYPTYYANSENRKYKFYKKNYIIHEINESGLVNYLEEKLFPSSLILFGSCSKGDFNQNSDIDIFVESKESKLDLSIYEKKLKRKINLLFEPNINKLSKELRNNIINGIILYGFIKIK
ncbi:nucleotidyltransferase family protein [Nanoarchaeota archaeon]